MLRYHYLLFILLITASFSATADIKIPKQIIIELIESRCDNPKPNPRVSTDLEYDCSDAYDDADGEAQSMKYSLRLMPLLKQDFNQDGIQDLVVEIESMGPLGGSVYTNSAVHYLLLDKDKRIIKEHEILLYAPFSEHIVEYDLENSRIRYSAIPNYRAHPEAYDDGELIEPVIEFVVNWVKGVPISSYYQNNCQLANSNNKALLKPKRGVTRSIDIDMHQYTQVITEEMQVNNLQISVALEGCDDKQIGFYIKPIKGTTLPVVADVLQALIPITYYDQQLKALLKLDRASKITFGEVMPLSNGWTGQIHVTRNSDNTSMTINLSEEE